ncbi:MAG: hypothetical protein CM1200mP1_04140 [Candidatus Neomarinimicrobiota bacterium]|nr:MAG: hypothetical protein CM1200mP1_04140 [Candidatus Neomarinimicrobiota bacterium]
MTPLDYMRKYGAFLVDENIYRNNEKELNDSDLSILSNGQVTKMMKL